MSKLVTIYGGSGFIGRYIARRLAKEGWRVRVAVRRPNEAGFVKPYGVVGQVEPIFCNIRDDDSVRAAMSSADAVVNCVGTFDSRGKNNFDAVQHEGAGRIARLAAAAGVSRMVHISAIGADAEAETLYGQSKGQGEDAILESFPDAVILRPSVMFGAEDSFFNRFAGMTPEQSKPLFDTLVQHATQPEFTCRFRWRNGSVAFWDNRCTMHYAINDLTGVTRIMQRVTIEGDRPF